MKGSLSWRIALTLLITLLGVVYALPTVLPPDSPLRQVLPDDRINLGLDLMGGIHLTLGVDVDTAVVTSLGQTGQDLRALAREDEIFIMRPTVNDEEQLEFVLLKGEQQPQLEAMLQKTYANILETVDTQALDNGKWRYVVRFKPERRKEVAALALDQAVKTIRNRIDQFGVSEPDIRRQEGHRIQVQLPGLDDPQRAIEILGKTAHLEFKLVDDDADIAKALQGILPPGSELLYLKERRPDGSYDEQPIVVKKDVLMTGEYISDANTQFNYNEPYVSLTFNGSGSRLFERITGEYTGKRLAIVLDGSVYSAPVIKEKIRGGRATITGRFTPDEAHDLAIVLRAGSLPAPVNILEERSVGPSLGQESIDQGINSALLGGALVLVFMIIYYGFGGMVADIVLALNILLIMSGLAGFGATLTLPGIAGIILTIGMAVDANVLIFERIREELRKGLTPRAAVDEGYSRATLTILDANVTTVIAAIILYQFGTGPIRGFAVTLTLGILASMFTAIFVSRIMFDLWLQRKGAKLSI